MSPSSVQHAGMAERLAHFLLRLGRRHHQRQSHVGSAFTQEISREFDRRRAGLGEERVVQRQQAPVDLHRALHVALFPALMHVGAGARRHVGGDGDAAIAALDAKRQRGVVLAGQHAEFGADLVARAQGAHEVVGGVLNAHHVWELCEPRHGGDAHVDGHAARNVVDDDRQIDRVVDRLEMLIEPLLSRAIVVRIDDQRRIGARLFRVAREVDRFLGRVRSGAGDHGHPPLRHLDAKLDDTLVLVVAQGRRFARGAAGHERLGPLLDLPQDEGLKSLVVDRSVPKWGDQRHYRALEHREPPQVHRHPGRRIRTISLQLRRGNSSGTGLNGRDLDVPWHDRLFPGASHRYDVPCLPMANGAMAMAVGWRGLSIALFLLSLHLWTASTFAAVLSDSDRQAYKAAFDAVRSGDWGTAYKDAAGAKNPILQKVVRFFDLTRADSGAQFIDFTQFLTQNPDWPSQILLRERADGVAASASDGDLQAWYQRFPPLTPFGKLRQADLWLAHGDTARAIEQIRQVWISADLNAFEEKIILQRYGAYLHATDYAARLDRLLWDARDEQAKRIISMVDTAHRKEAEARMALASQSPKAAKLLQDVPSELQDDPGLLFEKMRWRHRQNDFDGAISILDHAPKDLVRPDAWYRERDLLARHALLAGNITLAYRLAAQHGLTTGPSYADGEFLAGWIALRYLHDPKMADRKSVV